MTIEVGISKNEMVDIKTSESSASPPATHGLPDIDELRSSVRGLLDQEFKNIIIEEIRNGVQELMRTQRVAIGIVKEDFKQIIKEVLEEKIQSITENLTKPKNPQP